MLLPHEKIKTEGERLNREFRQRTSGYIIAAFGLVAGLAWNDAIQSLISQLFPLANDSVLAKFIYAVIITIVVVIVSSYFVRLLEDRNEENK